MDNEARRALAQSLDEIARGVSAATIDAEMGPMCHRSFFQLLHEGAPVTQADVDDAALAFSKLTERLMPTGMVHRFVLQACSMRLFPEGRHADLVPGFTIDEAIAGSDAATRRQSPMKKFTQQEALDCLRWNQREPRIAVAIAHLVQLVEGYIEGLRHIVARRSPEAAEMLVPFARQWAPKNVLKFVNIALFVAGRRRTGSEVFTVDQTLIEEALDLLNHSGAFTWDVGADSAVAKGAVTRIHCPAHAFLHRLLAKEGTLMTVIDFISTEAARKPPSPDLVKNIELMERNAISEETGIVTFGQEWSRMKLEA
ncbi:Hypothetical protein A7982_03657 [Minicystis rosea]|nr:Hypothetical protein A7982_03657 [Minicystis rosea]